MDKGCGVAGRLLHKKPHDMAAGRVTGGHKGLGESELLMTVIQATLSCPGCYLKPSLQGLAPRSVHSARFLKGLEMVRACFSFLPSANINQVPALSHTLFQALGIKD